MPAVANLGSTYETLTAMITPALFMTANGSLIISTSNRMSRVVDRIRVLNDLGDALHRGATGLDFVSERRGHVADQLRRLDWRSDRIRFALTLLYLAFALFVGTSLTIALDVLVRRDLAFLPTTLALLGVGMMLGACVHLVREAIEAHRSNRLEIHFFRALQDRREARLDSPEESGGARPTAAPGGGRGRSLRAGSIPDNPAGSDPP